MRSVSVQDIGGGWYLVTFRDRCIGKEWQRVYRKKDAILARQAFLRAPV